MIGLDSRAARYTWTAIFILLMLGIVYRIRETLFIFILALLFAYMLWPVVRFLDQRLPGASRVPALAIVYTLLVGVLILAGIGIGSRIASQANAFATKVPETVAKFQQAQPANPQDGSTIKARALAFAQEQIKSHSQDILSVLSQAVLGVLSHVEVLLFIVLVPILSFFFLKDGRQILNGVLEPIAKGQQREKTQEILNDIHLLIAQYIRALVLLSMAAFIAYTTFLSVIGAPYAILLAAVAAPLEFIPMIGPLTAAVMILLVTGLSGFGHIISIVAFLGAYRLFQDYVLQPYLLSAGMELHPLLIIFAVMAGGQIAGVAGSFLGVLVLASIRIIYRQLRPHIGGSA
jgi:predicted PurR-regulated permease PerM